MIKTRFESILSKSIFLLVIKGLIFARTYYAKNHKPEMLGKLEIVHNTQIK